jgi:hypothetical protein
VNIADSCSPGPGPIARRRFLKLCGATVAACLGGGMAILTPFRKALAAPPVWTTVPNQVWTVGVPVSLDLSAYCTDPEGDLLTFSLDRSLPPGVTRNGALISGTPSSAYPSTTFTATAEDLDSTPPGAPTDLRTE